MTDQKRRDFIRMAGVSAAIPVSAVIGSRLAFAQEMPLVDVESPQAVALSYEVDTTHEGQTCGNCALYQGEADAPSGLCPLFPGAHVGTNAWCSAWVAKG